MNIYDMYVYVWCFEMLTIPTDAWFWWILSIIITISDFMWNWVIWIAWRLWLGTYELPSKAIPLLCYSLAHCFMMVIGLHLENTCGRLEKKPCGVSWFWVLPCSSNDNPQIHFHYKLVSCRNDIRCTSSCCFYYLCTLNAIRSQPLSVFMREMPPQLSNGTLKRPSAVSATGQFLVGLAYSNGVAWRVRKLEVSVRFGTMWLLTTRRTAIHPSFNVHFHPSFTVGLRMELGRICQRLVGGWVTWQERGIPSCGRLLRPSYTYVVWCLR